MIEIEHLKQEITDAVTAAAGTVPAPVVLVVVNDTPPVTAVTSGRLLNATQLAEYLNLTPEYVKRLDLPVTCPAGFKPDGKANGRIYYDIDAVNLYLQEKTIKPGKVKTHRPGQREMVKDLKKRLQKSIDRHKRKIKKERKK